MSTDRIAYDAQVGYDSPFVTFDGLLNPSTDPYPAGERPTLADRRGLRGRRVTSVTVERIDSGGKNHGRFDGVTSGSLEWSYATRLIGSGKLSVTDVGQSIDWLTDRLRVTIDVNGTVWPLGVWLPTYPGQQWADGVRSWEVDLHSPLVVLDQDLTVQTYVVPAGSNVADTVRQIITDVGESPSAIRDSDEALGNAMSWDPGTPKLDVINALLDAAGYMALSIDGSGNLIAEPYVEPAKRPVVETFIDGDNCIYVDDFTDELDIFSIPNRVVVVGKGDGDLPGWLGQADNDDPDDPLSTVNRRIVAKPYTGVELTSAEAADRYARARLTESASPRNKVEIKHAPLELAVRQAVSFTYSRGGIGGKYVVDKTSLTLDPTGLQTTTLRKA